MQLSGEKVMNDKIQVHMKVENEMFSYDFHGLGGGHYLGYVVWGSLGVSWAAVEAITIGDIRDNGELAFLREFKLTEAEVEFIWEDDELTPEPTFIEHYVKMLKAKGVPEGFILAGIMLNEHIVDTFNTRVLILMNDYHERNLTPSVYLDHVERLLNEARTAFR
jgi:hypothetical protein